jgi:HK97 gp10 family phage protein
VAEFVESQQALAGIEYASARYARAVAAAVKQDMERLCPVDTGRLKASIHTEAAGSTTYIAIGTPYWVHVEFGTSKMRAQPFIRPALARRRGVVDLGLGG